MRRAVARFRALRPKLEFPADVESSLPHDGWQVEDHRFVRIWSHRESRDVVLELSRSRKSDLQIVMMWQSLYSVLREAIGCGGITLHAALMEREGTGFLLAGESGSGKSTCSGRLPDPWVSVCDDQALVLPCSSASEKPYAVHPLPTWSDYLDGCSQRTWNVRQQVPLGGIFFLEHSASGSRAVPIRQGEAAMRINGSTLQIFSPNWQHLPKRDQRGYREKVFSSACEIARTVPTFVLRVSPNGCFWNAVEECTIVSFFGL